PFSSTELRARARSGDIREVDLVRRDGERLWVRANKVGGLRDVIAQAALDAPHRPTALNDATNRAGSAEHRVVPLDEHGAPNWPEDTPPFGLPTTHERQPWASDGDAASLEDTLPADLAATSAQVPEAVVELGGSPLPSQLEDSGLLALDADDPPRDTASFDIDAPDADELPPPVARTIAPKPPPPANEEPPDLLEDLELPPARPARAAFDEDPLAGIEVPPPLPAAPIANDDLFADLELPPPIPTRAPSPPPPPPPPPRR
ncbi:MAG: DUF4339 domain-containing protein, partial [Planctomycetaceae bacterium]|nr:DUF4339 domain-containing protein [Planctomycetaceae bacterium]